MECSTASAECPATEFLSQIQNLSAWGCPGCLQGRTKLRPKFMKTETRQKKSQLVGRFADRTFQRQQWPSVSFAKNNIASYFMRCSQYACTSSTSNSSEFHFFVCVNRVPHQQVPQSVINSPFLEYSRFSGFRSLWAMFMSWRNLTAMQMSFTISAASENDYRVV